MQKNPVDQPVIVAGGGIGGLAAALSLARQGFKVTVLEQAERIGEIGAGIQLGPNAFHALDALGVRDRARDRAVYTDALVMHDAVDETLVGRIETGPSFRQRFGNPYAVIHRADIHASLMEGAVETGQVSFKTGSRVEHVEQTRRGVTVYCGDGQSYTGQALVGADGEKSAVRAQYVNDSPRVTGHVAYRAVVDREDFPEDLRWNAPSMWVGPKCHLVHYPLCGGAQFNLVAMFHSRNQETWGVSEGSYAEVESYFQGIAAKPRQLVGLLRHSRRWATVDREPISQWVFGLACVLGDAAHPTTPHLAQGACMAMEDAVTLGEALRVCGRDWPAALALYQRSRVARTARIVLSSREMCRLYHATGVERQVRNLLWQGRSQESYQGALEWLYGWNAGNCLDLRALDVGAGPRIESPALAAH